MMKMDIMRRVAVVVVVSVALMGCTLKDEDGVREDGTIAAPEDVAAPPADALMTESGIASKVLRIGMGHVRPTARSTVTVHYTLWTTDGTMQESSVVMGKPLETRLDGVIEGWTEGIQLMVLGEKRRFWIPGHLAYDNLNMPGYPTGMLVFDIELLNVR
jgi:peptidylprolyl isomerase